MLLYYTEAFKECFPMSTVVTLVAGEGFRIPVRLCIFLNPHRCALRKVFFVRLWVWQTASAKPTTAQGVFVSPAAICESIKWGKAMGFLCRLRRNARVSSGGKHMYCM